MQNKISVVIPNWNGKKYLNKCLSSINNQTLDSYEIIVVDNGSEDGSCKYIRDNFSEVKLIKLSKNEGFAKAVNIGIKVSDSDLVFLLNNDTELPVNLLEILYNEACKEKKYLFFACKMINYYKKNEIDSAGDRFVITNFHTQVFRIGANQNKTEFNKKQEVFSACGGAALYRKEFFNKVGYFDEDFFAFQEDIDISFRAQLMNYKCLFLPKAIVYHMRGGTVSGKSYWHTYYGSRNHVWLLVKNLPKKLFLKYFLQTFVYTFCKFFIDVFKFILYRDLIRKSAILGKVEAFKKIKIFLRKRKIIQSKIVINIVDLEKMIKK